jgi:hypothetical protein
MGLIAAVLLSATIALAAAGRSAHAAPRDAEAAGTVHYCSAADRQFLDVAVQNVEMVKLLGADYVRGDAKAAEVVSGTKDAEKALERTSPSDGSITKAKRYFTGMFVEYGRAVRVRENGGDASEHMYRSYSLESYAHYVLALAGPKLEKLGCDVQDLL